MQLDHLLSLYLPRDDKSYQLEYTLKKPTGKGGNLIVDAIVFGFEGKGNLAIDSKFPLENYLQSLEEGITKTEKEDRIKRFKENIKDHIKKVAEYISTKDSTEHAIMFIPSEIVFAQINEQSCYEVIEFALTKNVSICSPTLLAITVNQMLWTNQIKSQYKTMDKVVGRLQSFWTDFERWQKRWIKILDMVNKSNEALTNFDKSIEKIVKHGESIKKIEVVNPQLTEEKVLEISSEQKNEETN